MFKVRGIIVIACFLGFAGAGAFGESKDFKSQLVAFRQAVEDYSAGESKKDNRQLLDIAANYQAIIVATVHVDDNAKAILINELNDIVQKDYDQNPGFVTKISRVDCMYYSLLLGILREADDRQLLTYVRDASKSNFMRYDLKKSCFDQVIRLRISTYIKSPEKLNKFDKEFVEILDGFIDPASGITIGNRRRLKRQFVMHLLGFELPTSKKMKFPAANKAHGIKLAKGVVEDTSISFQTKYWFMEQIAMYDPDIHDKFLEELRKNVAVKNFPAKLRLKFARKLAELGEADEDMIKHLEQEVREKQKGREDEKAGA